MHSTMVKSAAEAIYQDEISRNALLRSGSLAYAFQLIRAGRFELAEHILTQFDKQSEPAIKELLFFLRLQISIAQEAFDITRKKILARLEQAPQNFTVLSLLQACIMEELEHAKHTPEPISEAIPVIPIVEEQPQFRMEPEAPGLPEKDSLTLGATPTRYLPVLQDEKTRGFVLWDTKQERRFSQVRDASLGILAKTVEESLPRSLDLACRRLEGGNILKICFAFENMAVTSFHGREENVAIITGPFQQSLITIVRAENLYTQNLAESKLYLVP